jgi:hypothetical protein
MRDDDEAVHADNAGNPLEAAEAGPRDYTYYRCAGYNSAGYPRTRLTELDFDQQVRRLFDQSGIKDDELRGWLARVLLERAREIQARIFHRLSFTIAGRRVSGCLQLSAFPVSKAVLAFL